MSGDVGARVLARVSDRRVERPRTHLSTQGLGPGFWFSLSLWFSRSCSLSLSLSLSRARARALSLSFYLSRSRSFSLSRSLSLTHPLSPSSWEGPALDIRQSDVRQSDLMQSGVRQSDLSAPPVDRQLRKGLLIPRVPQSQLPVAVAPCNMMTGQHYLPEDYQGIS